MPRYQVVQEDGQSYIPLRYDNFAALGATVDPPVPWILVPVFGDISDVVSEALALRKQHMDQLASMGVLEVERRLHPSRSGPEYQREIEYRARLDFPFRIFRGERSLSFNIMPTRCRFSGEPDPAATTRRRIEFERQCAARMKAYLNTHGAPEASDEQARAAVRHFGVPSSYVDFTFHPEVAASFAHPAFTASEREHGAPIGIFYSLGIENFEKLFGMAAWSPLPDGRDIHYINIASVWRIPYKSFDPEQAAIEDAILTIPVPPRLVAKPMTIRTRFVPAIARIAAQEGLFLDLDFEDPEDWWSQVFLWTILDFASRKWCFLRKDFAYENPAEGITAAKLFPPDDPELAALTAGFGSCL